MYNNSNISPAHAKATLARLRRLHVLNIETNGFTSIFLIGLWPMFMAWTQFCRVTAPTSDVSLVLEKHQRLWSVGAEQKKNGQFSVRVDRVGLVSVTRVLMGLPLAFTELPPYNRNAELACQNCKPGSLLRPPPKSQSQYPPGSDQ